MMMVPTILRYFVFIVASSVILVQACLRAPHVVADEAKLTNVFTNFFLEGISKKKKLR